MPNSDGEFNSSLSKEDRNKLKNDSRAFNSGPWLLKCYMGVWDEGVSKEASNEGITFFLRDRKYECFFIDHKPSMLFPAAIELQKRSDEIRRIKNNQKFTIIGLYIAGLGLLLNAAVAIYKTLNS